MQVTETLAEGLKREYKVVISAADIAEKVDARLDKLKGEVRIPGFRPGKVPTSLVKKRFGQAVLGEVLESALQDSSKQALEERGLRPAVQPDVELTSYEEGKDLEYELKLEVLPEIDPMPFEEIELERIAVEPADAEVEEALGRLAQQQRSTKPLDQDRPAEKGDVLVVDFKGTVDGEAFPGMEAQDHHLELGSNAFVEGFEDQLIGKSKGDEAEVRITFPEAYANDKLSGKEAVFQVTIKDVLEAVPAALDDELAKSFGAESLDKLKEQIRESLAQEYAQAARSLVKRKLLDALAERCRFEVPEKLVNMEFDAIWHRIEEDMKAGRLDEEDKGKDEETLKAEYRGIAERRVRLGLLLAEVGRQENIEVSQEELQRALLNEVRRYPGQEQAIFEHYQKNPGALVNLRGPLLEEKVVDHILDKAKVTERKLDREGLQAELEAAENAPEGGATEAKPKPKSKAKSKAKTEGGSGAEAGTAEAGTAEAEGGEAQAESKPKKAARKSKAADEGETEAAASGKKAKAKGGKAAEAEKEA